MEKETVDLEAKVVTEVTSIAKEEARTGKTIKMPSAEEMVQRASISLVQNLRVIDLMMTTEIPSQKLSNRAIKRALLAGLQMPTEGLPVTLKQNEEKQLFGLIQRVISDRFILIQHHIVQEAKKEKAKKEQEKTIQKEDSHE